MLSTLYAFLGACTLVAASPGPSTVLIVKHGGLGAGEVEQQSTAVGGPAAPPAAGEAHHFVGHLGGGEQRGQPEGGDDAPDVGRLRTVLSRAGVRRRLEQVSGGVLLLLGVLLAPEG
ncbi:hypothetical protein ACIRJO_01415 [Streptomyces sp. NPDC102394]|uniref:hypothetical protein n=1 Tax=Streptomyces sp. NPDC102394 TaxID=3366167 RepID=UPI003823993D